MTLLSTFDQAFIAASLKATSALNPSYMHTFGITNNYFIIVEQPLTLNIPKIIRAKLSNDPLNSAMTWRNDEPVMYILKIFI